MITQTIERVLIEPLKKYLNKDLAGLTQAEERKGLEMRRCETGGYALVSDAEVREMLQLQPEQIPPTMRLVSIKDLTTGDTYPVSTLTSPFSVVRRDETEQHSVTDVADLGLERIPTSYLIATPAISQRYLDAKNEPVETWLLAAIVEAFYWAEAREILVGQGSPGRECEGALLAPNVETINSGHASQVTEAGLRKLFYDLNELYRRQSTWVMHSTTLEATKGLTDGSGNLIFKSGEFGVTPDTLYGRPVVTSDDMPTIAANAFPIAFGAWAYYCLVVRLPLSVLRDPFTKKGFITFDFSRRSGGQIVRPEAFRKLKISA
jgi:HK97 family phage major capsid protein